jgi:hypothetical protein
VNKHLTVNLLKNGIQSGEQKVVSKFSADHVQLSFAPEIIEFDGKHSNS